MRIDLHNHTVFSADGFNRLAHFEHAYRQGRFDVLAITDHHTVEGALRLREHASFPLIVGQEVLSRDGEIIGLFIERTVPRGLTAEETAARIKEQGGLVYVPHPFLRVLADSLRYAALLRLVPMIDILEAHNGLMPVPGPNRAAAAFATRFGLVPGAGSDAHVPCEIGVAAMAVPDLDVPLSAPALLSALRGGRLALGRKPPPWQRVGERLALFAYQNLRYAGKGTGDRL